ADGAVGRGAGRDPRLDRARRLEHDERGDLRLGLRAALTRVRAAVAAPTGRSRRWTRSALALEVLHLALVLLGGRARRERAEGPAVADGTRHQRGREREAQAAERVTGQGTRDPARRGGDQRGATEEPDADEERGERPRREHGLAVGVRERGRLAEQAACGPI